MDLKVGDELKCELCGTAAIYQGPFRNLKLVNPSDRATGDEDPCYGCGARMLCPVCKTAFTEAEVCAAEYGILDGDVMVHLRCKSGS